MWCRLQIQELDRGVFRCAVVRVEREEQWGENAALRSSNADRTVLEENFPSLTSCCLSVRKLVIHWQTEVHRELCQFILKGVRDDGVNSGAEVYKQDPHISPRSVQMLQDEVQSHVDCIIHRPVCSVGKLRGSSKGPMEAFRYAKTSLSNDFMATDVRATGL